MVELYLVLSSLLKVDSKDISCTSRKTINVKTAPFHSILFGNVKSHLKIRNGFYSVIIVSDTSNIWIVGDLKQDSKILKDLYGVDYIRLNLNYLYMKLVNKDIEIN